MQRTFVLLVGPGSLPVHVVRLVDTNNRRRPTGDPDFDADVCFEPGFDRTAVEPEDERLANIYDADLVGQASPVT